MEGACTEAEWNRFQLLQELCPQEKIEDLYRKAKPYLKRQESFNKFMDDFTSKIEKRDSDIEEERIQQDMKRTFMAMNSRKNNDSFWPEEKYEHQRIHNVRDSKKTSVSLWENMENSMKDDSKQSEKISQDHKLFKIDSEVKSVSLWENIESSNDNMHEELEKILYGPSIYKKKDDRGTVECAQTVESDGDESFHSLENENDNALPCDVENQNQEINLVNLLEDDELVETGNRNDKKCLTNEEFCSGVDSELIETENGNHKKCLTNEELCSGKKNAEKISTDSVKEPSTYVSEKEDYLKADIPAESNEDFSYFNQLISKNYKIKFANLKPENGSEKNKSNLSGIPLRAPAESSDTVSNMIDYFFYQPPVKKGKETFGTQKSDYESQGAIPKKIFSEAQSGNINSSVPDDGKKKNSVNVVKKDKLFCNEMVKEKLTPGQNLRQPKSLEVEKAGGGTEKKIEMQSCSAQELKIPGYPFIYVVSDDFSPAFRLPKGNYCITNSFEDIESLKDQFQVLYHPSNEIGKTTEPKGNLAEKNVLKENFETDLRYPQILEKSHLTYSAAPSGSNVKVENVVHQTRDLPKKETVKNNTNIKGKIFCNTPLQSLKKEGDDRNDSADAYGAILQSVADDFKCSKKNNEEIKYSQSYDKELSSPGGKKQKLSESPVKKSTGNDYELRFSSSAENSTLNCKVEENDDEDEDENDDGDASSEDDSAETSSSASDDSNSVSKITAALEYSDPNYLKEKLKNCGDDKNLRNKVMEDEIERNLQSKKEAERIVEGYVEIFKELPTVDPEYLLRKWTEIAGDEVAVKNFIAEEKLKVQLEEIKNKLFINLPLLDREFLESKSREFLFDTERLGSFINEERKKMIIDEQFVNMVNRLPSVDPVLLRGKVEEFKGNAALVEDYIEATELQLRLEEEKLNQMAHMISILPDADPVFLEEKCQELNGESEAFNNLLSGLLESKNYPKIDTDPASRERMELWRRFVDNFDLKDFLSRVPNPEELYCGSKGDNNKTDINFITKFLQSRYPNESTEDLVKIFRERRCNLTNTCAQLDSGTRPIEIMDFSFRNENITEAFLLEAVFILHRREIREYLREEKELRELKLASARSENSLLECACCFEDELLETDVATCPDGHIFCLVCVRRSVETKLSDAVFSFSCLADGCTTEFTLAILEKNLPRDLYDKVLKKKQSVEVTEAKVPGLETCPSCDFAYIPDEADKVFKCQNKFCLKEICRKCKEANHVPLRCEEVERPNDTNVRTKIEEKMTEALVRTCPNCGKKFVKTDGCNKMTCVCGAIMCYLCRKPVQDYRHFNGQGGDRTHLCPLYSNNDEIHVNAVRRVGQLARDEAFRENPDLHLVHDPTKTL